MNDSSRYQNAARLVGRIQAAHYCNLSASAFSDWVRKGKLPGRLPGTACWDLKAMDRALDALSGLSPPEASALDESSAKRGRASTIPFGAWPRRMPADMAAGYCGESTVEAFLKRVGVDYPQPRICEGRRRLWLKDDLDAAILPPELAPITDIAGDL